jgi:hypothetical protein
VARSPQEVSTQLSFFIPACKKGKAECFSLFDNIHPPPIEYKYTPLSFGHVTHELTSTSIPLPFFDPSLRRKGYQFVVGGGLIHFFKFPLFVSVDKYFQRLNYVCERWPD